LLSVEEVSALTGLNRNMVYHLIRPDPRTKTVKLYSVIAEGKRKISMKCLEDYISSLHGDPHE